MKKSAFIMTIFVLIFMCSCQSFESNKNKESIDSNDETINNNESVNNINTDANDSVWSDSSHDTQIFPTTPPSTKYRMKSYEEFFYRLQNEDERLLKEKAMWGEQNELFLDFLTSTDVIELPRTNGEVIPLVDNTNFSIVYRTRHSNGHPYPTIQYVCDGGNEYPITIYATYLPLILDEDTIKNQTADKIYKKLSPKAVNVDNFPEVTYSYLEDVYCKEIQLKDETVSALVYDYEERFDDTYMFYTNGWWLVIYIYPQHETYVDEFLRTFSFA